MLRSFLEGVLPRERLAPANYETHSLLGWQDYPPQADYQKILHKYSHGQWQKNMDLLFRAYALYEERYGEPFLPLKQFLESAAVYEPALQRIKSQPLTAHTIEKQLQRRGNNSSRFYKAESEVRSGIREAISSPSESPLFFVSGDHATTHTTFTETVKAYLAQQRRDYDTRTGLPIGLWVLDHHIDTLVQAEDWFGHNSFLGKANVLLKIAQMHQYDGLPPIQAVGVTGVLPLSYDLYAESEKNDPTTTSIVQQRFLRHIGQSNAFHVTPEDWYTDDANVINEEDLLQHVDETMAHFARRGIRYLYTSFDMDVLKSYENGVPRTGMEYSLLSAHLNIGVQDLPALFQEVATRNDHTKESYQFFMQRLHDCTRQLIASNRFTPPLSFNSNTAPNRPGMPISMMHRVMERAAETALRYGIHMGVPIGDKLVGGDITELAGIDYQGNTADSAVAILERMEQMVRVSYT